MTLNKPRIVILGGKGMLGTDLVKTCNERNINVQVFDLPEFDITNLKQLEKVIKHADVVINCAAYTNVDGSESQKELAYKVNAEAAGRLGAIAGDNNTWVLHIGTDFVFDGRQEKPYIETDLPNPISEYGRTKLAGEQLLAQSGCKYCIVRVQWTYGSAGNNFVSKLIQRAKTNNTVKVVDDQVGSPTATTEVSKAICRMLEKKPLGLFHFASSGYVSRYEMAKFVFDKLSMNVNLLPCKTSDYVTPAARPLNSRFDCSKIAALLGGQIESWQVMLERYLKKL
ncbi:MAG: dTDP-4-dehydrorhamnose reductase [Sedimentisphaerales bacterium]|nr:dTDP-4-dehydrorhamnose reductase [Sedimentisphaerales bacterium]